MFLSASVGWLDCPLQDSWQKGMHKAINTGNYRESYNRRSRFLTLISCTKASILHFARSSVTESDLCQMANLLTTDTNNNYKSNQSQKTGVLNKLHSFLILWDIMLRGYKKEHISCSSHKQ